MPVGRRQTIPQPGARRALGLTQCGGVWAERAQAAGQGRREMQSARRSGFAPLEFGWGDAGLGREVDRGSAAKAIVAARNSVIMTMPVMLVRRRPGVVDVLFGAGL